MNDVLTVMHLKRNVAMELRPTNLSQGGGKKRQAKSRHMQTMTLSMMTVI